MNAEINYRVMRPGEEVKVCSLIEKVFNEFVAPEYGPEGINEFFKFANPLAMAERSSIKQIVIVAEYHSDFVGVIEMRDYNHIAMLFVSLRGKGIGKELTKMAIQECRNRQPDVKIITVNSSPFAEPIYSKIGFKKTGPFQERNGITFVPMTCDLD